jgi:hypothetical protein
MGKIGKGAFGSAHLLVHKDTSKYFVIKKIRLAKQTGADRLCQHSCERSLNIRSKQLTLCIRLCRLAALLSPSGAGHGEPQHTLERPAAAP